MNTQNYVMFSGDDKTLSISCVDDDNVAVDVTGGSATYIISDNAYSAALVTKTSAAGEITLSGSTITVTIDADDTEDLDGKYYHELQVTDGDGDVFTSLSGAVIIRGDTIE